MIADVPTTGISTVYAKTGDVLFPISLLVLIVLAIWAFILRARGGLNAKGSG
jgi:hypothetical protein